MDKRVGCNGTKNLINIRDHVPNIYQPGIFRSNPQTGNRDAVQYLKLRMFPERIQPTILPNES